MLERIRDELRLLRDRHAIAVSEGHLDSISAEVRNGKALVRIDEREAEARVFHARHSEYLLSALVEPEAPALPEQAPDQP